MKTVVIIAGLAILLSGCGLVQQAEQRAQNEARAAKTKEAEQKDAAVLLECKEKRLSKEVKGWVGSVNCSNPRIYEIWREAGDPYLDLLGVELAARLVGAENVDKGKVTEAELLLQLAELRSRLTEERRKRDFANADMRMRQSQVAAQESAARAQSSAAFMQGLAALQAANRPAPSNSVSCTTTGTYGMRTTNCN
jgi:hypothetical protein